jgi:protein phosphatase
MYDTKELKNFTYFGESHKGKVRTVNEDAFAYFESINGCFFVLCDGMGGIKGGKKAAEITIAEIEKTVNEYWEKDTAKLLFQVFQNANNAVYKHFSARKIKPGTTLLIVLIRNNKIYYAHAGDSRIYYQTGRKLFQITRDHSYVAELLEKKLISKNEAQNHPRKNEITNAVGTHQFIEPDICKQPVNPADDDFILLCSDGLTNELSDKEILEILRNNKNEETKVKQLIAKTLEKGAQDNVTVQLIRFYNTGREKNTKFKENFKVRRKKRKISLFIIISLLLFSAMLIQIYKDSLFKTSEEQMKPETRYSTLFIYESAEEKVFLEKYVSDDNQIQNILMQFQLSKNQIGEKTEKKNQSGTKSVHIPVENIYFHRLGKEILSYPEINNNNVIDILRINEKSELYFKPGEVIVIPMEKSKNGR